MKITMMQLEKEIILLRGFGLLLLVAAFWELGWGTFFAVFAMTWVVRLDIDIAKRQTALKQGRTRL